MKKERDSHSETQDSLLLTPPGRKKRGKKWGLISVVLLAALGLYFYLQDDEEALVDQPLIATVTVGDIENTISSAGSLKPSIFVDVGAQVSGQLQKLHVEVGDKVEAGQLLAEIDARTQVSRVEASRAALAALEAQVSSRRASLDLSKANAQRQERLMAANATSQQDYDTATANLASAGANVTQLERQIQQSRSTLNSEETQLEFTRIYAPIAGTVVSIEMNEGRTLNANQQAPTILRVADLSTMTVQTEISEADIGSMKTGMDIYFTTLSGGSRRWVGTLRQVLPTPVIENNVVLYTGLFDVDNADGALLPEMTAQVFFITSAARAVLMVPVGALTFADAPLPEGAFPAGAGAPAGARLPPDASGAPAGTPVNAEAAAAAVRQAIQSGQRPPPGANGGRRGRPGAAPGETPARRLATVRVIGADGIEQERNVVVGITSRVNAEVISGLVAGEQVIAGILQAAAEPQGNNNNQNMGIPRGMVPGGFR
ncbi:MAG: efflux RND transporter periplasmic adaptor subunit [Gammaproteobacteria bacterium]|nr:efflux RND transporter periplasmic adaptor subunit [Gammaproteobacteria bacterium]